MVPAGDDPGLDLDEAVAPEERRKRLPGIDAAAMQVARSTFGQQPADALRPGGGAQRQLDAGKGVVEPRDRRRQDRLHPDRVSADPEAAGEAGNRSLDRLPDRVGACSSAASSSRSTRRARSAARAPREVRRTPDGMRSNSRPPKRASSRATVRESAGWEMARRSAAATIFPVSATARRLVRSVRLSNIAPLAVSIVATAGPSRCRCRGRAPRAPIVFSDGADRVGQCPAGGCADAASTGRRKYRIPGSPRPRDGVSGRRARFGSRLSTCVRDMDFAANGIFNLGFVPLIAFARLRGAGNRRRTAAPGDGRWHGAGGAERGAAAAASRLRQGQDPAH